MIECIECNIEFTNYKSLSTHIKNLHNLSSLEYITLYYGEGICKECGNKTQFKNLNIGFRDFCSVKCLNIFKSKDNNFLKKLSLSQKGKPRKKHSQETKEKISKNSKNFWDENRDYMIEIFNKKERIEKLSLAGKKYYKKNITYINNIRCESKHEELFVEKCLNENIRIKRFVDDDNNLSIKISDCKWVLPDFKLDNIIVDVKDFHHWFREELFNGLNKYILINEWCKNNGFIFIFWFKDYGYHLLDRMLLIKNEDDLKIFKKENKNK